MSTRLILAFFASGASGLIYEVLWVRQLGHLLGSTMEAASVVTAVFVLGLGIGAWAAGPVADRQFARQPTSLVRAYVALEVFIGAWGLLLSAALPALARSQLFPSAYALDERGWHTVTAGTHALQALLAGALVLPPALAMGATLVVLVRALVPATIEGAGAVAVIYAANTAGASLGAFAVDALLVPGLGVSGAAACAVALNLLAAVVASGAAVVASGAAVALPGQAVAAPAVAAAPAGGAPAAATATPMALAAAVFLAGLVGMALEIVWFRYLSSLLGAHRATFSLILAVILIGIWIGSAGVGWLAKRTRRPLLIFVVVQSALVVSGVLGVLAPHERGGPSVAGLLLPIVAIVGPASLCLGTSFPLANAAVQRHAGHVGRRAGSLYLLNMVGGLLGSLLAGFALVPLVGMQRGLIVIFALAGVTLALVAKAAWREQVDVTGLSGRAARRLIVGAATALLASLACLTAMPRQLLLERVYARDDIKRHAILFSEGRTESIAITARTDLGAEPERILYVDGALMSGTLLGPQRYMRAMAHVPLLMMDAPATALVICFGVGNTAHAVSLHPTIQRLDIVDLSRQILEHGHHFARWNGGVLSDPRTQVYVADGRQHLRTQPPQTFDLVTLEPPPIAQAGVGALYAEEFYALARSRTREGGFVTQWLPAYQVTAEAAESMVRSFVNVFPDAVLLRGFDRHLLLMGRNGGKNELDPDAVLQRLAARAAVQADLARVALATPRSIAAMFAADGATLDDAMRGVPPATDDWPISEYAVSLVPGRGASLAAALFDTTKITRFCPGCFQEGVERPIVQGLTADLAASGAEYASREFRKVRGSP